MPLDVIISNQKFLIIPNKTAIYRYLHVALTVKSFSLHFLFLFRVILYFVRIFSLKIQHDGSASNANFPINRSIKVAKDCLTMNEYLNLL